MSAVDDFDIDLSSDDISAEPTKSSQLAPRMTNTLFKSTLIDPALLKKQASSDTNVQLKPQAPVDTNEQAPVIASVNELAKNASSLLEQASNRASRKRDSTIESDSNDILNLLDFDRKTPQKHATDASKASRAPSTEDDIPSFLLDKQPVSRRQDNLSKNNILVGSNASANNFETPNQQPRPEKVPVSILDILHASRPSVTLTSAPTLEVKDSFGLEKDKLPESLARNAQADNRETILVPDKMPRNILQAYESLQRNSNLQDERETIIVPQKRPLNILEILSNNNIIPDPNSVSKKDRKDIESVSGISSLPVLSESEEPIQPTSLKGPNINQSKPQAQENTTNINLEDQIDGYKKEIKELKCAHETEISYMKKIHDEQIELITSKHKIEMESQKSSLKLELYQKQQNENERQNSSKIGSEQANSLGAIIQSVQGAVSEMENLKASFVKEFLERLTKEECLLNKRIENHQNLISNVNAEKDRCEKLKAFLESQILDFNREKGLEWQKIETERKEFQKKVDMFEIEKQHMHFKIESEKAQLSIEREQLQNDQKKMREEICNNETRLVSESTILNARQKTIDTLEEESRLNRKLHEERTKMELMSLQTERNEFQKKLASYHNDMATLKAEQLKCEILANQLKAQQTVIDTENEKIYQNMADKSSAIVNAIQEKQHAVYQFQRAQEITSKNQYLINKVGFDNSGSF